MHYNSAPFYILGSLGLSITFLLFCILIYPMDTLKLGFLIGIIGFLPVLFYFLMRKNMTRKNKKYKKGEAGKFFALTSFLYFFFISTISFLKIDESTTFKTLFAPLLNGAIISFFFLLGILIFINVYIFKQPLHYHKNKYEKRLAEKRAEEYFKRIQIRPSILILLFFTLLALLILMFAMKYNLA
jgi:hypothetical protein